MLRNSQLLSTLKSYRSLRDICIKFTGQFLDDTPAAHILSIPLKGFRNLTLLELYDFYGDETKLAKEIAGALWDSPGLKTLGLGKLCDCDHEDYPEIVILESGSNILEKLCIQYGSRSDVVPLALETLRLGHGLCLVTSESTTASDYLEKLTTPASLRTLHVYNGLITFDPDEREENLEIDWSLLNGCTSLHQLSVSRLTDDVATWLNDDGRSVQELIVTDHYKRTDWGLENFDALFRPQLSMLFTLEIAVSSREANDDMADTDSSDSWTNTNSSEYWEENVSDQSLADNNSEVDRKKPHKAAITVLDRLQDGGSHLSRLGLSLDFETQWVCFTSPFVPSIG